MTQLEQELTALPVRERLRLARVLLDSILAAADNGTEASIDNPLLAIAGIFDGGPGNSADHIEEIVSAEIARKYGLTTP